MLGKRKVSRNSRGSHDVFRSCIRAQQNCPCLPIIQVQAGQKQRAREIRSRSPGRRFPSARGNMKMKTCTSTSLKSGDAKADKLSSKLLERTFPLSRLKMMKPDAASHPMERFLCRKNMAMEGLSKSPGRNIPKVKNTWFEQIPLNKIRLQRCRRRFLFQFSSSPLEILK